MKTLIVVSAILLAGLAYAYQSGTMNWCMVTQIGDKQCYYGTYNDCVRACQWNASCVGCETR